MDTQRFVFDLVSAVFLFVIASFGAIIPRLLSSPGGQRSLAFQLGNMLSAGVMLSAGFCHLLPQALPDLQTAVRPIPAAGGCELVHIKVFPYGTFLCALGLIVTLLADKLAESRSEGIGLVHARSDTTTPSTCLPSITEEVDFTELLEESNMLSMAMAPSSDSTEYQSLEMEFLEEEGKACASPPRVSFLTAIFLFVALSLHSVLEGTAMGAQSTISKTIRILVAIGAHKGLSSYALGSSLVESQVSRSRFLLLSIGFALASPFGILLGYVVSEFAGGWVAAALSAFASGTFLYVSLFEVIPMELEAPEFKVTKMAAMVVGFSLMSLVAIWA